MNLTNIISSTKFRIDIILFLFLAFIAISLRYYATLLGYTSDTETFLARGIDSINCWSNFLICPDAKNVRVYVPSAYGIFSYYENGLIYLIANNFRTGLEQVSVYEFQRIYAIYLSLIDTVIAFILYKNFGKIPAFLYVIAPASFLISGLHTQLDNVALMYASLACIFYMKSYIKTSIFLFSVSLSFKLNILVFLPILFLYPLITRNNIISKHRISYTLVPIIAFGLYLSYIIPTLFSSTLLNLDTTQGIVGAGSALSIGSLIIEQTFHYSSFNHSVTLLLMKHLDIEHFHIFFMIFFTYIFLLIVYFYKPDIDLVTVFGLYLILIYSFSPRLHEQYITWLIVGCFLLWKYKIFLIPNILASIVMLNTYSNVSISQGNEIFNLVDFRPLHDFFVTILKIPALIFNTRCTNCGLEEHIVLQQLALEINSMVLIQMTTIVSLVIFLVQLRMSKVTK